MRTEYVLIIRYPEGVQTNSGSTHQTREAAARTAAHRLHRRGAVPEEEAQEFSALVGAAPLGEFVVHEPSGYAFRTDVLRTS